MASGMANFLIDRAFRGDADTLVERAKIAIRTHQVGDKVAMGKLDGDGTAGSFSVATLVGDVIGLYTIRNGEILIEITSKPIFVSYDAIASGVDTFLHS